MVSSRNKGTLEELKAFYDLLKKYRTRLESETQSNRAKQELEQLREELVRQSGRLRQVIETLTRKLWVRVGIERSEMDIWDAALHYPRAYYTTEALTRAMDLTNEAIGNLQTTTFLSSESRYQLTSPVYWGELFHKKVLRQLWAWITSHRKSVSWTAIGVIVVTLLGTNWDLVKENIDRFFKLLGMGS